MENLYGEEETLQDIEQAEEEDEQLFEHFRFVADRGQTLLRVDKFLFDHLAGSSRNRIQKAADAGFGLGSGKPVKSSYKVKPADIITVMMDRPRFESEITPEDIPRDIVYEDSELMVVNKP